MFVTRLAHNLRMMRKIMLRADSTISPFLGGARELPIKFQMVYVERGKRHESLQPRYGPAIVLKNEGKVLTIKYLHGDGKTHTVNIERVKSQCISCVMSMQI